MDDTTSAQHPAGSTPDEPGPTGARPATTPDRGPSTPGWSTASTQPLPRLQPPSRPDWAAAPAASLGESAPPGSGAPDFTPASTTGPTPDATSRGTTYGGPGAPSAGTSSSGPAATSTGATSLGHGARPTDAGSIGPGGAGVPPRPGTAGGPATGGHLGAGPVSSAAFGVPLAPTAASPAPGVHHTSAAVGGTGPSTTTATRRPRPAGLRAMVAAVALAAVVGAGTGIGGYAVLDQAGPAASSPVSVSGGNAPVSAQLDGTVGAAAAVIAPSTVTIEVSGSQSSGVGTGIVLDTQGHVLTNQHVVAGAGQGAEIQVTLDDGRTASATVVGQSTTTDLAVIRLDDSDLDVGSLTPATFATSDSVTVGQAVVAVGAPLGLSDTVTSGVVSNTARPVRSGLTDEAVYQAVQTDAAINPGNSGGPLVDLDGRVIGINSSIASTTGSSQGEQAGNIGIGFAIPADVASRVASEIIATGSASDASLGVGLAGTDSSSGSTGATVQTVQPGSAAEAAGLQPGDVVTEVQGVPTGSPDALIAAIRFWAPGTTVTITYQRDGQTHTADATLGTA